MAGSQRDRRKFWGHPAMATGLRVWGVTLIGTTLTVSGCRPPEGIPASISDLGRAWPGCCGWLKSIARAKGGALTSWGSIGPTVSPTSLI